jgi:hypothetical protein
VGVIITTPEKSALYLPDGIEHPFGGCKNREEIQRHHLQNIFYEN